MARTIKQIYDEMISEKESMVELNALHPNISSYQTLLSDLTTNSKVAAWRLIFFVAAVSIWTVEKLFDEHKSWIENRAKQLIVGNTFWYQQKCFEFQYGDSLQIINGVIKYPVINDNAKIIKLASVTEVGRMLIIKVAKLNGADPEPLTATELEAFNGYVKKVRFAGCSVGVLSREADLMKISFRVYIDPMVLNSSGQLLSNPTIKPVEEAINDYCKSLPFDGVFSITELTDKIQMATGVINPVFESVEAKYGANAYQTFTDYYTPNAGYLQIDPLFPLSGSITYLIQ